MNKNSAILYKDICGFNVELYVLRGVL